MKYYVCGITAIIIQYQYDLDSFLTTVICTPVLVTHFQVDATGGNSERHHNYHNNIRTYQIMLDLTQLNLTLTVDVAYSNNARHEDRN